MTIVTKIKTGVPSGRQTEFFNIMEQARLAKEVRDRAEQALYRQNDQMQHELALAAEFQRAVLPKRVDLPYLDIAIVYRP